jgi:hypothetical protein
MADYKESNEFIKDILLKEIDSVRVPNGLKEKMWGSLQYNRNKSNKLLKFIPYIATIACIIILIPLGINLMSKQTKVSGEKVSTFQNTDKFQQPVGVYRDVLGGSDSQLMMSRLHIQSKVPMKEVIIHWDKSSHVNPSDDKYQGNLGKEYVRKYKNQNITYAKYKITIYTNDGAEYKITNNTGIINIKTVHPPN